MRSVSAIQTPESTLPEASSKSYFLALTGVRALAAWMVFLQHNGPVAADSPLFPLSRQFFLGVNLFFVLSGFLIAYRYSNQTPLDYRLYFRNRIARIFPLYMLLTTMAFVWKGWQLGTLLTVKLWVVYLLSITLLKGLFSTIISAGLYPSWSLAVEETFYILAPWSFSRIRRNARMLYLLPLFFIGIGLFLNGIGRIVLFHGFFDSFHFLFFFTFFGRAVEFFVGIALARRMFRRPLTPWRYGLKTISGIILFGIWMYVSSLLLPLEKPHANIFVLSRALVCNILLPLTAIRLLYEGLIAEKTLLARLLSSRPFQLLGKSSYAFYLIHTGLFYDLMSRYIHNDGIIFILMNLLAIGLYKLVETPLNNWLRR